MSDIYTFNLTILLLILFFFFFFGSFSRISFWIVFFAFVFIEWQALASEIISKRIWVNNNKICANSLLHKQDWRKNSLCWRYVEQSDKTKQKSWVFFFLLLRCITWMFVINKYSCELRDASLRTLHYFIELTHVTSIHVKVFCSAFWFWFQVENILSPKIRLFELWV